MAFTISKLSSVFGSTKVTTLSRLVKNLGGTWFSPVSGVAGASLPTVDSWTPVTSTVTGSLTQGTTANKPSLISVSGSSALAFDTDEFIKSDQAASEWKFLHSTAGCTIFIVTSLTGGSGVQKIMDTCNGNLFQHGISVEYNASSNRIDFLVANGTGTALWYDGIASNNAANMAIYEMSWSPQTGVCIRKNGATQNTGDITGTPSTSNPSGALTLGAITAGSIQFLSGNIGDVILCPGVPTTTNLNNLRTKLSQIWSITLATGSTYASSDCSSDPRFILPVTMSALVDKPFEIYKDNVYYRDGYCLSTVSTELSVYTLYDDRWRLYPATSNIGNNTFTVNNGGYSDTSKLIVTSSLEGSAATKIAVIVGDSLTAATGSYVKYVKDELGAKLTLTGTQINATYRHEGYPGRTWEWFATDPASPFTNGSGVIDIASYLTTINSTPDYVVWFLGTNDINAIGNLGILEEYIGIYYGYAESLIDAWQAASPTTKHIMCFPPRGASSDTPWTTKTARQFYWTKHHRFAERFLTSFDNRAGEKLYTVMTNFVIGGANYSDNVHPTSTGYIQIARPIVATLTTTWNQ